MRNLYAILAVCLLLGHGCAPSLEPQRRSIALRASVGEILVEGDVMTKVGGDALDAALWLSFDAGSYSHAPSVWQNLPCVTTVSYESQASVDIRHDDRIILYPITSDENYDQVGDYVYCVGFHPSTGWGEPGVTPVTSASHDINGSEDLMFADQMVGSYADNFTTQIFSHLLTWVKINVSTTSLKAAEVWGPIESLEIVSPDNTVSIGFSSELQDGKPKASTVSYGGVAKSFSLTLPDNNALTITTKAFGQAFCAPPASAARNASGYYEYLSEPQTELGYIVRVRTRNIPQKEVFVALKKEDNVTGIGNADYAVGKLFVINLHFNEVKVVEGICTLRQWDDQRSDIYLQ